MITSFVLFAASVTFIPGAAAVALLALLRPDRKEKQIAPEDRDYPIENVEIFLSNETIYF